MSSENEYLLKICILGQPTKMKCDFIKTFVSYKLEFYTLFTGSEIVTQKIQVENYQIKLILVVTDSERDINHQIRPSWYRGASAVAILYDKGDKTSFNVVEERFRELREHIPDTSIPITLVGIQREPEEVTTEQAQVLAENLGIQYVEISLDDREKIEQIFYSLTKAVLDQKSSEG